MRTTVDIDEDVLAAAKDLARAEGRTMGQVISDLARRALTQPSFTAMPGHMSGLMGMAEQQAAFSVDDFPSFPPRAGGTAAVGDIVTSDMVRRLQDAIDLEDAAPQVNKQDIHQDQPGKAAKPPAPRGRG
jgi:hypothetical protein